MNSSSYKKRSAPCEDPFTPAKILREGSVLDILKTPGKWTAALVIVKASIVNSCSHKCCYNIHLNMQINTNGKVTLECRYNVI